MDENKIWILVVVALTIAGTCLGCSYINKKLNLQDDNLVEEVIEEAIRHQTGIDVDLTPQTPEGW